VKKKEGWDHGARAVVFPVLAGQPSVASTISRRNEGNHRPRRGHGKNYFLARKVNRLTLYTPEGLMSKFVLLSDVARLMKKRPHQITYAITSGLLPEPEMRIGGRRVFQAEDVERIARYFGVRLKKEAPCKNSWTSPNWDDFTGSAGTR
jgi:hypothetical protein